MDFRVGAEALKDLRYAVFGCGNSLYADTFNKASHHACHLDILRRDAWTSVMVYDQDMRGRSAWLSAMRTCAGCYLGG